MKLTAEQNRKLKRTGWVSFLILALAQFMVQFHRNSPGVMKDTLTDAFHMNATAFGTLSAMYFYPYMLAQIPMGVLMDVIGVRATVAAGSFVAAIGATVFGFAGSFPVACIGRMLIGIGVSVPVICSQKLVAAWFPESRIASIFSTSSVVAQCGALVAQYPLAVAIDYVPWRVIFFVSAAASLILAICCWLFVRNDPTDIGLPSMAEIEGRKVPKKEPTSAKTVLKAVGKTFANRYGWPVFVVMAVHQGLFNMFASTWAIPYLQESFGYTGTQATAFTTAMMIASIVFSFFIGSISDRLRSRKIVIVGISLILLILYSVFWFGARSGIPLWLLWAAMIIMGIGGCGTQIILSYSREINNPMYVGISVASVNVVGMLVSSIMPTVLGAILDKYAVDYSGGMLYSKALLPCVIIAVVGVVFSFLIKDTGCKNRYVEWGIDS